MTATHFIVMGVSGCGKSSIAEALAKQLNCQYIDGDDYHPKTNIEKMQSGQPLNDDDREDWLIELNQLLEGKNEMVVLACSALKAHYRDILSQNISQPIFVYLKGDFDTIWQRHKQREHHFFQGKAMLENQFQTLEVPTGEHVITVEVSLPIEKIVKNVCDQLTKLQSAY